MAQSEADAEIVKHVDSDEPDVAKISISKYTVKQDRAGSSFAVYEISMESNKYGRWQVRVRRRPPASLGRDHTLRLPRATTTRLPFLRLQRCAPVCPLARSTDDIMTSPS